MKIIIINGPNLNLLGIREKSIYGDQSFDSFFQELKSKFSQAHLDYFQSNHEGEIIDKLQAVGFDYNGIILNGGGFTHTSVAIGDAIKAIETPVVEVHISNVYARESFRHTSYFSANCIAVIVGAGLSGYRFAIEVLLDRKA